MENYILIKNIGEGSFGKAMLVKKKQDGKQCVIKEICISKMSPKERTEAKKEVTVLAQLKHPNIVSYLDSFQGNGNLYIVMDYCEGGDLYQMLVNQRGIMLEESKILDLFVQCCLAVKHIHDRKILHRDIKTQNIFLTKHGIVKMGDFGIARVLKSTTEFARTCIGTPYYLSPEIVENRPYNNKSDIWSLGCVLYELTTLKHAFEAGSMKNLIMKIVRGSYPPIPSRYSHELRSLVAHCLKRSPKGRPSINTLLKKPIIQNRITKFLSPEVIKEEFHTVLHKEVQEKPKKPEAKRVEDRRGLAAVYAVSVARKSPTSPYGVLKPAVFKPKKLQDVKRKEVNSREKRIKERVDKDKKHLEYMEQIQKQRYQNNQNNEMKKAREEGWRNILGVKNEPDISVKEEKPRQVLSEEKSKVKGNDDKRSAARQEEVKQVKLLDQFWQSKNEANLHKEKNNKNLYNKHENDSPLLQFHNQEMERHGKRPAEPMFREPMYQAPAAKKNNLPSNNPLAAARNKQELIYLKQLEEIRRQNYLEKKRQQVYRQRVTPDPLEAAKLRKQKIDALQAQAEQRSKMLRQELEARKKKAVQKIESERIAKQNELKEKKPKTVNQMVDNDERKISPAAPSAFREPLKLFRSCSENDVENLIDDKQRKHWEAKPPVFMALQNVTLEITASAMDDTVQPTVNKRDGVNRVNIPSNQQERRSCWNAEGKTQLISNLNQLDIKETVILKSSDIVSTTTISKHLSPSSPNNSDVSKTIVLESSKTKDISQVSKKATDIKSPSELPAKSTKQETSLVEISSEEKNSPAKDAKHTTEGKQTIVTKEEITDKNSANGKTEELPAKVEEIFCANNTRAEKQEIDVKDVECIEIVKEEVVEKAGVKMQTWMDKGKTEVKDPRLENDEKRSSFARVLLNGTHDAQKQRLRCCSMPNLNESFSENENEGNSEVNEKENNDGDSSKRSVEGNSEDENETDEEDKTDEGNDLDEGDSLDEGVNLNEEHNLDEGDNPNEGDFLDEGGILDEGDSSEGSDKENDFEHMLESMRNVLNSSGGEEERSSDLKTNDDNSDWESDSDEKETPVKSTKKESLFSNIEESRIYLEDELGFDLFMKIYKYIQREQESGDDEGELSGPVLHLLADKQHLYEKILHLVIADAAYLEVVKMSRKKIIFEQMEHCIETGDHIRLSCLLKWEYTRGALFRMKNLRGFTLIHVAAMKGDLESLDVLLKHGGDVHKTTQDGWTALHAASHGGNYAMVNYLLHQCSASPLDVDVNNQMPCDVATNTAVKKLLTTHGESEETRRKQEQVEVDDRMSMHHTILRRDLSVTYLPKERKVAVRSLSLRGAAERRLKYSNFSSSTLPKKSSKQSSSIEKSTGSLEQLTSSLVDQSTTLLGEQEKRTKKEHNDLVIRKKQHNTCNGPRVYRFYTQQQKRDSGVFEGDSTENKDSSSHYKLI